MVSRSSGVARPLPKGPHKLTREQVTQSQRDRLLNAMACAVAEKGYAKTTVADVLMRSGVSRATFYQLFTDKDHCFKAAYEQVAEQLAAVMRSGLHTVRAGTRAAHPLELLEQVVTRYLDVLHAAPALARTFLVEVYAAGPAAIAQRRESLQAFVDIVAETHRGQPGLLGTAPEQRLAVEFLVGAMSSLVTNIVGAGALDELPRLLAPLMELAEQLTGRKRPPRRP